MMNTVHFITYVVFDSLHSPVLTSVVTATEQQAVARNPVPQTPSSSTRCSLTVMVLVVVMEVGVEVPQ